MTDKQHLQELAAYELTVSNLRARVAELESQLAAAPQAVQAAVPMGWIDENTLRAMKESPKSEKTRWPSYNLGEYASKEGMIPVYDAAPAHPAEGVPAQDWQDAVAEAAQARAAGYEGDDRKDIKTDVFNAFAKGADWERRRASLAATQPAAQGMDAQNPQNAVLDISTRPTVQIHWSREGDPLVMLHSVGVEMDGSCTTAGMLEAVAAAINDYAKQARKKYGGGIPWDTMNFVNVRMRSRDGDGDCVNIDGHSVIQTSNKPPHGVTINHPAHIAAQAKQGEQAND